MGLTPDKNHNVGLWAGGLDESEIMIDWPDPFAGISRNSMSTSGLPGKADTVNTAPGALMFPNGQTVPVTIKYSNGHITAVAIETEGGVTWFDVPGSSASVPNTVFYSSGKAYDSEGAIIVGARSSAPSFSVNSRFRPGPRDIRFDEDNARYAELNISSQGYGSAGMQAFTQQQLNEGHRASINVIVGATAFPFAASSLVNHGLVRGGLVIYNSGSLGNAGLNFMEKPTVSNGINVVVGALYTSLSYGAGNATEALATEFIVTSGVDELISRLDARENRL